MTNNSNNPTLVFPAVNQAAIDFLIAARQRGERTICAASVANEEIAAEWGGSHRLPAIYDADFAHQFLDLVETQSIARVFCPVAAVHDFMRKFIAERKLDIELIGQSPIRQQVEAHRRLIARANKLLPLIEACAEGRNALSLIEVAGMLRQSSLIYGESNDDKLAALMGIFASAPQGDVVEIGSLMGRSAFVLLYLAWRYRVGAVLTVDPWMVGNAIQHDSPEQFQALVDEWDFEVLSQGFYINMIPARTDDHAHLRMPSDQGYAIYSGTEPILSQLARPVPYNKKIAVIHIDGNHDYACCKKDCELWLSNMVPQSWLILDDYLWAHGDGPYRVGNELLVDQADRIERSFVCGKALFVKFK
ncbi:MAG: class I SAM-dependent methyltransferase [Burkholderiales bacterium]|nr:class I SAM-dependent methyltransferase [Burkholderiales bacterium]